MIKNRYEYLNVFKGINDEYPWLQELHKICEEAAMQQSTNFERDTYKSFIGEIATSIGNIENLNK